MYDIPTIKTNLTGVVGWRQPLEAKFAIIDALVNAIREQQKQIDQLKQEVQQLKSK